MKAKSKLEQVYFLTNLKYDLNNQNYLSIINSHISKISLLECRRIKSFVEMNDTEG